MKSLTRSLLGVVAALVAALPAAAQNQVWIRQLGTSGDDRQGRAEPDGSGGVYLGGRTDGSLGGPHAGQNDVWLERRDGAGARLWIRQIGTSGDERGGAKASDGAGGVYVGGRTDGSLGGPHLGAWDVWLARYDGAGSQLWIRQYGTGGWESAWALASNGAGGVFQSGLTNGSLGGPGAGAFDAWVARYDGAGNQLWIRQFGTNKDDWNTAATPDGAGGVYLTGWTAGSLGGPSAGNWDIWVARYDGSGNQLWIRQLGTIFNDRPHSAAPDGAGGVYVVGEAKLDLGGTRVGGYDAWLARYDGAGNQLWIRQFGTIDDDSARAAAPDGAGGST